MVKHIYMDHTSGKPVDAQVLEAMQPYFSNFYGNPASIHSLGNEARKTLEEERTKIGALVGAKKPEEVSFTSGATESNNLAIRGVAYRNKDKGNQIITSAIEHMSVINSCKSLVKEGFDVTYIPVDKYGLLDLRSLEEALTERTILVSIMYANGEIGVIQLIRQIGEIVHRKGTILHVDATTAVGQVPINVENENIDLMSISSNDIYGPRGAGALYVKTGTKIQPIIYGGGQEKGLRSGTENIPAIVGMGKAAEIAKDRMIGDCERISRLRNRLIKGVSERIPSSFLNGHAIKRVPDNANLRFSYVEGESLILNLDILGISCSSGSACTSKTLSPSHVLMAIGLRHEEAHGSILLTLGRQNTDEEVEYVLEVLPDIVKKLRVISPLTPEELR